MKKILALLLFIVFTSLTSCSIVDDKEPGEDLLGSWKLIEINDTEVYDPNACTGNTRILVKEENLIKTTYFDAAADCGEKNSTGSWEYLEEDQYSLEIIPEWGPTKGRVDFESIHIFDFYTRINDEVVIFTFERI